MPPKKDKLKCYTLKANDGHKYVKCVDDKTSKQIASKAMTSIKEVENMTGNVNVKKLFIKKAKELLEEETPPPNTTRKPANYDMLRPEIRKNILEFADAKTPIDVARNELIKLTTGQYRSEADREANRQTFFVVNNTLDKIGSRNLKELDIATTYKKTPRARKIFLRDPIVVLKEYRKRTGETKYKNVIERSLNRVKVYLKLISNVAPKEGEDRNVLPSDRDYVDIIRAVITRANAENLLKNDFYPAPVKDFTGDIDGSFKFGIAVPLDFIVAFERLYRNARSEGDFNKLVKLMNFHLTKFRKEQIAKNTEKRRIIDEEQSYKDKRIPEIENEIDELKGKIATLNEELKKLRRF